MKIKAFSKIKGERQDGAIYNGFLFSFNHQGLCTVYRMNDLNNFKDCEAEVFSEFVLDKNAVLMPHSNAVSFGNDFFEDGDEFPLLYTNVYNNYAQSDDKLKGVCLVYRVQRFGTQFKTTLVQMIECDFVEDEALWA